MTAFYTPEEAWEELRDRRQAYYEPYLAAFGGEHGELARTAAPGSFWKRGGKVKLHVPAAADIAATGASLLFGREPRYAIYDESLGDTEEGSQRRLEAVIDGNSLNRKLHEAAECAAADARYQPPRPYARATLFHTPFVENAWSSAALNAPGRIVRSICAGSSDG